MTAVCRCTNGHTFTSRVLEDDWTTGAFEVEDLCCPKCNANREKVCEDFHIIDLEYDDYE